MRPSSRRNHEHGIILMLVAVVLLFVVGAMAALSIDVVTLYTARSEAQLAADGAALAGARVLANSGMTSAADSTVGVNAKPLATAVAQQVAANNQVGGRNLNLGGKCPGAEICVTINESALNFVANPQVTVQVQRSDLPTFFARIWGRTTLTVKASATAEAYNPSGVSAPGKAPVAPTCVKPWLLPNMDPSNSGNTIFDPDSGALTPTSNLLGWTYNTPGPNPGKPMSLACGPSGDCTPLLPAPTAWSYYPGDDATFPHPTQALPTCSQPLKDYQKSIAGCIEKPISCNSPAHIDTSPYPTRNTETADAVNCLTHATNTSGDGDQVDLTAAAAPSPPFQFLAGANNPVAGAAGSDVLVSSSLVTVPVFKIPPGLGWLNTGNVQIVGFVQLFLNPDSIATPATGLVNATVINMAGCGTDATGTPILGNGASPVAVRLISTP